MNQLISKLNSQRVYLLAKLAANHKKVKFGILVFGAVLLFFNIIFAYNSLQRSHTIIGLKFEGQPLSFKNRSQIADIIKKEAAKNQQTLKFSYQDQTVEVKKDEIGARIDAQALSNSLISIGRDGNFLKRLNTQTETLLGFKNEKLKGEISQSLLSLKIIEVQNQFDKPAMPIRPDFTGNINKTLPAEDGIKTNTDKLTVEIADNIFKPPDKSIPLPIIKTFTYHKEDELAQIKKQAANLTKQPISVESANLVFTLSVDELKKLMTVVERPNPKDPKKLILALRLNDIKLSQKLGDFAANVENVTHAEFDNHDSLAAIYSQFYSGKRKLAHIPTGQKQATRVLGDSTGQKIVYLTFDDGPNSIYHPMILDILKAYDVKATFFLVGQNAEKDSAVAQRTYAEGHKVGNHSLTHTFLPKLNGASILNELATTDNILNTFDKNEPTVFFRPPYGGVNLSVKQTAENLHLKMFLWDVDPRDWSEPETQELVNRVVNNTTPGADILLHSNHISTVKALPKIIETLKNQGYTFETLN